MKRHHQLIREHERLLLDRAIAALSEIECRTGKILAKGERRRQPVFKIIEALLEFGRQFPAEETRS
jgi:hypothetical protein